MYNFRLARILMNSVKPARYSTCSIAPRVVRVTAKFEGVEKAPPDPIFGLTDAYRKDNFEKKLNLGVGAYRDEQLKPFVLKVVREAERRIYEGGSNHEYLTIDGLQQFQEATRKLLLGDTHPAVLESKVATVQTLSGTGALRIGGAFLNKYLPDATVYVPTPTWGNHNNIFGDSGCTVKSYRYYNPNTIGLDYDGLIEDLKAMPKGSAVVLHGCAHNPTGVDPTHEQWKGMLKVFIDNDLLPFFDVAYQGFATGDLNEDAYAPRLFAAAGIDMLAAQSYSKNLGLYGERIGGLNVVCNNKAVAECVHSQLKRIIRGMYSNPPAYGARIVCEVINDGALFNDWNGELAEMSGRIGAMRVALRGRLEELDSGRSWEHVTKQIGMFSFTGLTKKQVELMISKHHVYMTADGRISLAGLNAANVDYMAASMIDVIKQAP